MIKAIDTPIQDAERKTIMIKITLNLCLISLIFFSFLSLTIFLFNIDNFFTIIKTTRFTNCVRF